MKLNVILFNTENTGDIMEVDEISDEGTIKIDDCEYTLDKTKPILLKNKSGTGGYIKRKLNKNKVDCYYILKTNTTIPLMSKIEEKEVKFNKDCPKCGTTVATYPAIKREIVPVDDKFYKSVMSPKIFKDTAEMHLTGWQQR